jgi:hypothetical protein
MPARRWLDHPHTARPYDPYENRDDTGANYPPGLLLKAGKPHPRIFHLSYRAPVAPFSPQGSKP